MHGPAALKFTTAVSEMLTTLETENRLPPNFIELCVKFKEGYPAWVDYDNGGMREGACEEVHSNFLELLEKVFASLTLQGDEQNELQREQALKHIQMCCTVMNQDADNLLQRVIEAAARRQSEGLAQQIMDGCQALESGNFGFKALQGLAKVLASGHPISEPLQNRLHATLKAQVYPWLADRFVPDSSPDLESIEIAATFLEAVGHDKDDRVWASSFTSLAKMQHAVLEAVTLAKEPSADIAEVRTSVGKASSALRLANGTLNGGVVCASAELQQLLSKILAGCGTNTFKNSCNAFVEPLVAVVERLVKKLMKEIAVLSPVSRGAEGGAHWTAGRADGESILDCYDKTLAQVQKGKIASQSTKVESVPP